MTWYTCYTRVTTPTKYTHTHTHYTPPYPRSLPLHHPATSPVSPSLTSPSSSSSFPSFPQGSGSGPGLRHPNPIHPFASSHPHPNLNHWRPQPLLPRAPHLPAFHLTRISTPRPGSPTIAGRCSPAVCAASLRFWSSLPAARRRRVGFPPRHQGQHRTPVPLNCVSFCD